MPQSASRKALSNLCHSMQIVVEAAIAVFEDSSKTDAEALAALQSAGQQCIDAVGSQPSFYGSYGIYFNDVAYTAFTDGGASLVNATIPQPGYFQFSGLVTSVGPYALDARLEAIVSGLQNYASTIDTQEAAQGGTGTPGSPSISQTRVAQTLQKL